MQILHFAVYTLIAIILLVYVGNLACQKFFRWTGLKIETDKAEDADYRAGWIIGGLERSVLAVGIVTHSWEVLAAVVALKTVARFKELDDQRFAEYFLVGSLFSILWAVLITATWLTYDHHVGLKFRAGITQMIKAPSAPKPDDKLPKFELIAVPS